MRFPRVLWAALCFLLSAAAGIAQAREEPASVKQITETIAKVQSYKTVEARTEAAEYLARLTQKMSKEDVTGTLVTDIMSLLDSPDDSVRYWIATALGNIGRPAKAAVPKLQEMLPKADCISGAITSASGIRYALIKMGVKPQPAPKCGRIAG